MDFLSFIAVRCFVHTKNYTTPHTDAAYRVINIQSSPVSLYPSPHSINDVIQLFLFSL